MGVKLEYEEGLEELRVFVSSITKADDSIISRMTKRAAELLASIIRKNLPIGQRLSSSGGKQTGHTERIHMRDDVVVSGLKTDKSGEKYRTVGGGQRTGTLWHIVEYGTSRNQFKGKHFMEKSMREADAAIEAIYDEEIRKGFDVK